MSESKLSLNVAFNKQKSKVLFAEAGTDFVDLLLSFLTLPLGKIMHILMNHDGGEAPVVGSLTSLYRSISDLDGSHFSVEGAKQILLNPRSRWEAEWRKLKLDITHTQQEKYFVCADSIRTDFEECRSISMYADVAKCCKCGGLLNREISSGDDRPDWDDGGAFMMKESTFLITDDLRVVPVVSGFLQTIDLLGITDADEADLTSLSFGIDDDRQRCTTSTNLFNCAENNEAALAINYFSKEELILHVTLQISTNKFLFAQVGDDFVEFLLRFLTSSLGGFEQLLRGKTSLKTIDNLYHSVTDAFDKNYFRSSQTRDCLINPKKVNDCFSENRILPFGEDRPRCLYFESVWTRTPEGYKWVALNEFYHKFRGGLESFTWRKGPCRYVKEKTRYIVSDDLTVTPYGISSSTTILNGLGIPLSDVRETELHIGRQEALHIVKASLTSKAVITDVLMMKKVPKKAKLVRKLKQFP